MNVSTTASYHPQGNGTVELFHRTLKNALQCAVKASKSWSRSLPWVLLGLRNAPKTDSATSTAEVVFGTPLRIPGRCFCTQQAGRSKVVKELQMARINVATFMPDSLDLRKFKESPFIAK